MELSSFKKDNLDLAKIEINKIATRIASKLPELKSDLSEDTYTLLSDALVIAENISNNKDKEFLKTSMQRFSSKLCEAGFNDFYQLDPDFRKKNKETVLKNITPVKPRTGEPNKELISNTPEDFKFTASSEPPMKVAHRILDDLRHKYYSSAQDAYEGYCQDAGPWPYASSYQKWKLGQILTHFGFVINYDKFEKQAKKDYETQMKADKKRKNVDADPNKVDASKKEEAQILGNPLTGEDAVKGFVDKIQDIAKRRDTQALRQVQNEMMQYRQKNGGTNPDLNRLLDIVTGVLYKISNQPTNAQKLDKKKMRQDFAQEFGAPPPGKNDFNVLPEEGPAAPAPVDMSQMTPNQIAEMEQSNKLKQNLEQQQGVHPDQVDKLHSDNDPMLTLWNAIQDYGRKMNAPKPIPQVDNNEPIPVDTNLLQKSSNKQNTPLFNTPLFQYFWNKVHDPVGPYAQDGKFLIDGKEVVKEKETTAQAVGSPIPAGTDNMTGNSTALPMQDHPIMACSSCGYKDTTAGMMKEGDNCPTCNGAGSMAKHSMHNYAKLIAKHDGYLTKEEVSKLSAQAADIMNNEDMLKVKARYLLNRVLPYVKDTK